MASANSGEDANPLVSIMLVNWNTREMTLECLRSVIAQTKRVSYEIIVVDNGSKDSSAEAIAQEFPEVRLMAESQNHGFAKATNLSVEKACGRFILLLNTDTVVLDGAIDSLVNFALQNPAAGIWGGRTVFADGSLNPDSCWGKMTPWSVFCMATGLAAAFGNSALLNPEAYGGWQRDAERTVDVVQGSFFLIKRDLWDHLGGFDKAFFMFGEEADLCARAVAAGASPLMTPDAQIVHYGGQSTKVFADRIVYVLGGRIGLIKRHFSKSWQTFGVVMTLFWAAWRAAIYRLLAKFDKRFSGQALQWTNAWRRRSEWKDGPPAREIS